MPVITFTKPFSFLAINLSRYFLLSIIANHLSGILRIYAIFLGLIYHTQCLPSICTFGKFAYFYIFISKATPLPADTVSSLSRVTGIIRTRPKTVLFKSFRRFTLERRQPSCGLNPKNPIKITRLRVEDFLQWGFLTRQGTKRRKSFVDFRVF